MLFRVKYGKSSPLEYESFKIRKSKQDGNQRVEKTGVGTGRAFGGPGPA